MADNQGGTSYTQIGTTLTVKAAAGDFIYASIWYRVNISSPSGTFTVTATVGNASDCALAIVEYPLVTASPVDQNNSAIGTSTGPTVTLATTTNATDAIVGLVTYVAGTTTITPDGTNLPNQLQENEDNVSGQAINVSDRSVTSTGTYTANFTLGAVKEWGIVAAALKLATGGAAQDTPELYGRPRGLSAGRQMSQLLAQ